jgi:hypothetical protein
MFGQLLPNKNKIATVWRDTYYVDLGSKLCHPNKAVVLAQPQIELRTSIRSNPHPNQCATGSIGRSWLLACYERDSAALLQCSRGLRKAIG